MGDPAAHKGHDPRVLALKATLLLVWAAVTFGAGYFSRDLGFQVAGWPFNYWMAAQGSVLACLAIVAVYAWAMHHLEPDESPGDELG